MFAMSSYTMSTPSAVNLAFNALSEAGCRNVSNFSDGQKIVTFTPTLAYIVAMWKKVWIQ